MKYRFWKSPGKIAQCNFNDRYSKMIKVEHLVTCPGYFRDENRNALNFTIGALTRDNNITHGKHLSETLFLCQTKKLKNHEIYIIIVLGWTISEKKKQIICCNLPIRRANYQLIQVNSKAVYIHLPCCNRQWCTYLFLYITCCV